MRTGGMYTTKDIRGRGSGSIQRQEDTSNIGYIVIQAQEQKRKQRIDYIVQRNENLQGQRDIETGRYERQRLYRQIGNRVYRRIENKVQYTEDLEGQEQIETGRDEERDEQLGKGRKDKRNIGNREKHSRHSPTPRGKGRGGGSGGQV